MVRSENYTIVYQSKIFSLTGVYLTKTICSDENSVPSVDAKQIHKLA